MGADAAGPVEQAQPTIAADVSAAPAATVHSGGSPSARLRVARRHGWDAALAAYLTRQAPVPAASLRAEDEPATRTPDCVCAVTVARAQPEGAIVVVPLAQFVAVLRNRTTPR